MKSLNKHHKGKTLRLQQPPPYTQPYAIIATTIHPLTGLPGYIEDLYLCDNIRGVKVDMKVFNLLLSATSMPCSEKFDIGLNFAGLEFRLPWEIRDANPFHVESGTSGDSALGVNGGKLLFFPDHAKWDRESAVFIPIKWVCTSSGLLHCRYSSLFM